MQSVVAGIGGLFLIYAQQLKGSILDFFSPVIFPDNGLETVEGIIDRLGFSFE